MIYGYLLSNPMIDLDVSLEESTAMQSYLDESFLITESKASNMIKEAAQEIKDLCDRIKRNDISDEMLKEKLEDIYDKINVAKQAGFDPASALTAFGCLTMITGVLLSTALVEVAPFAALGSLCISLLMGIVGVKASNKIIYDKTYDALINIESKFMVTKRKAKKDNNIELEKKIDKCIEIIEDFKTKRRKEVSDMYQEYDGQEVKARQESAVVTESDKSEAKINNFRQSVDEVNRALNNAFNKIKLSADVIINMITKANSINEKNKDKVVNDIIDIGKQGNDDFFKQERIDVRLYDDLLKRWSKTFSAKYSPYGMKVREKFEDKVASFNDKVIEYVNGFYDKVNSLMGEDKKEMKVLMNKLFEETRKKSSVQDAERIHDAIASWYNNGLYGYLNFIRNEIAWTRSVVNTDKIKHSLRYKLLSKIVK